jgi:hypothetical protein
VDANGARHLQARLTTGAAVGERVQLIGEPFGEYPEPGAAGVLISIEDAGVRVLLDSGVELLVDPAHVRALRGFRSTA